MADHGEESYRGSEKLAGMTAIITGGDSGIGRAVALCYAREGANVVLNYLCEEEDAKESESLFWLPREALNKMAPGGSIIHTVSIQGYDPSPNLMPYAATKSALIGMTKALAKLAIDKGVRANAVAPGPVWTPLIPGSMPGDKVASLYDSLTRATTT